MKYKGHEIISTPTDDGREYDIYENCIYIETAPTLAAAKAYIDRTYKEPDQ